MKAIVLALILAFGVSGCASDKGQYETYGLLDSDSVKQDCVRYSVSYGNVI